MGVRLSNSIIEINGPLSSQAPSRPFYFLPWCFVLQSVPTPETGSMKIAGINRFDATTARKRITSGALKVADYVKACLDRIAEREGDVGAFTYLADNRALAQAIYFDTHPGPATLQGIPVAIKDI